MADASRIDDRPARRSPLKVVWATPYLPDPTVGGGRAHEYSLLRHAAARHSVTLVTGGVTPGDQPSYLADIGVEVVGVPWQARPEPATSVTRAWRLAVAKEPFLAWSTAPCSRAMAPVVAGLVAQRDVDLVHVSPGELAPLLAAVDAPTALNLHDSYTVLLEREAAQARALRHRVFWGRQAALARRWERATYAPATEIASVSHLDAAVLARLLGRPIAVVPLAIDDNLFDEPTTARASGDALVVFVSAFDYRPNVDAAQWLVRDIWPRVRAARPDARLALVGRNPVPEVHALAGRDGVELHADVPDVRPWYWSANAVVAPVRLGAGTRSKVLHALACRGPLVTTATAAEGIAIESGVHALVADDAAGFAAAIAGTLDDGDAAAKRAERGRSVAEGYRPDVVGAALDTLWAAAVSKS